MLTRPQKEEMVKDLSQKINKLKLAVIADYQGLKVNQIRELKKNLKEAGIDFQIAKNNLLKIALKEKGIELDEETLKHPLALIMGYEDEVMPAKKVAEFAKDNESLEILGGISKEGFVEIDKIKQLASLPGREELYSMLIGRINAPRANFVEVLRANLTGLISVLKQYQQSINK